jgi:hypothetical protein
MRRHRNEPDRTSKEGEARRFDGRKEIFQADMASILRNVCHGRTSEPQR